mmetsp:Transcript_2046/g.6488  ORF Transcript_2046/g.6488 Transcript_2046/m.6488 type:complete len:242 (-) Transcript_2046:500-1225(-)
MAPEFSRSALRNTCRGISSCRMTKNCVKSGKRSSCCPLSPKKRRMMLQEKSKLTPSAPSGPSTCLTSSSDTLPFLCTSKSMKAMLNSLSSSSTKAQNSAKSARDNLPTCCASTTLKRYLRRFSSDQSASTSSDVRTRPPSAVVAAIWAAGGGDGTGVASLASVVDAPPADTPPSVVATASMAAPVPGTARSSSRGELFSARKKSAGVMASSPVAASKMDAYDSNNLRVRAVGRTFRRKTSL